MINPHTNRNALFSSLAFALALAVSQTGCAPASDGNGHGHETDSALTEAPGEAVQVAVATLHPTEGHEATGTVTFTQEEEGVRVVAEIQGMSGGPGKRGFHIHEHGDCSAPDALSAGGHFNPHDAPHGGPDDETRHAGDFGNIEINEEGVGHADFIDTHITLSGPHSIVGRAVIVHAEEDDLETQPTGDAGPRAACGVIDALN